tara:strand:+ start:22334 stop:23638 length:1305 start_codon:yes stop_codon:yes gene_type:complete
LNVAGILRSIITSLITSENLHHKKRQYHELKRLILGRAHDVHFFYQADDPYSHLGSQILKDLNRSYDVNIHIHIVGKPNTNVEPMRKSLEDFSIKDAALIAPYHNLEFKDSYQIPEQSDLLIAQKMLSASENKVSDIFDISKNLWDGNINDLSYKLASDNEHLKTIQAGNKKRKKMGHYLGAMFYFAGEWYWGLDRLPYMLERLDKLKLRKKKASLEIKFINNADLRGGDFSNFSVEFFVSLRSPYSYLALPEIIELKDKFNINTIIRPVLPMVMRGLPVPREKVMYIVKDAKREASRIGIPFGKIYDPLGKAIKRGYSLLPYAKKMQRDAEYLFEFSKLAWSEGKDMKETNNLKTAIENASLDWNEACDYLDSDEWKPFVEENRKQLIQSDLWGVPSFRIIDQKDNELFKSWGRDRLWLLTHEIKNLAKNLEY